jgi:serine/threonine protein kinase/tetratricopeptide (TPR) repeat protein
MSKSHQRESDIFDAALELPPEQRASHLDKACAGDAVLRARLEALLNAGDSTSHLLESPVAPAPVGRTDISSASIETAGDHIGRYKLLQQIGEGGCGVVYMAEQLEPVSRRVALKIIKLGLDTKSVIARFEAERQALALMDHPNIARVLDAGATETGRPYFVMELVRGLKITDYCDGKKLSTRARLDLFIQVCHAIQHAHQKGIIHRDIKPSNILVTVNDGVAVPKVIDFGIAKATTGQKLTHKTLFTAFEQFIGTPAYMSPEQATLTSLDIDTRSDIYALGVLLYELLTGKTPFDAEELLSIGLDEMRRTIREQEPQRPSTRLSTLSGQELSTTAQRRGLDAPKLVSELRGDLDWIIMKALEKDRSRRYETATGLAADIQRHLHDEPVIACPPARLYRFQKMVRRNKLTFVAGSAVAASLIIGLSLSTVSFFRERVARQRADEQTAVAKAVSDFLQEDLLRQADSHFQADAHFTPDPNLTVRAALDRAAERIGERFKNDPLQEAAVRMAIGNALIGLGQAERALPHVQRALELRRLRLTANHPDTLSSMHSLGWAYVVAGKLDLALPLIEETLKLRRSRLGRDHPDTLRSMNALGNVYSDLGKTDLALTLRKEMLNLSKARLEPNDQLTLMAMGNLALSYWHGDKLDDAALPLLEQTAKLAKDKLGTNHPYTALVLGNLAAAYAEARRFDLALSLYREVLTLNKTYQGLDHPATLHAMRRLGSTYQLAGKADQALALLKETLNLTNSKLPPDHPETLATMSDLARCYLDGGKSDQALPLLEEVVKLRRTIGGTNDPETWKAMWNLSVAYLAAPRPEQAVTLRQEMLTIAEAKHGPGHPDTLGPMGDLGIACRAAGKFDQALPLLEKTVKLHEEKMGPDDPGTLRWMNDLGIAYWWADKRDDALLIFQEALPRSQKKLGPDDPRTLMTLHNIAWITFELGRHDQALHLLEEKLKLITARHGVDAQETLAEKGALARAYEEAGQLEKAIALQKETLERMTATLGSTNRATLLSMGDLAVFYDHSGKSDLALPLFEEALNFMKSSLGTNDPDTVRAMRNLAATYQGASKLEQALQLSKEAFTLTEQKLGSDNPDALNCLGDLIDITVSNHRYTEAENLGKDLLARLSQRKAPPPAAGAHGLIFLAQNLLDREQWTNAEQITRGYLAVSEKTQPDSWETLNVRSLLGGALLGQRKIHDAQPLVVTAYDGLKKLSQTRTLDSGNIDDLTGAMDRLETLYELCQDHPDSIRWKAEIERVRKINDPGAIRDWLVLAPIPLALDQSPVSGLEQEQIDNEASLRPHPREKTSIGSHSLVWREYHLRDYAANFNRLLGGEKDRSVVYAVCYVQSVTSQAGLLLKVGSDDQARVYLNGKKVYENLRARPLHLDEDTIPNIELVAGLNVVVFKVVNGDGGWGGSLRFMDKDDQSVEGIKILLEAE